MSIASAQTFIVGKTYNSDFSSLIDGVELIVTCGTNVLTTTSLDDGTYAVGFEVEECNGEDAVSISATKGSLTGSNTGVLQIDEESFDYYSVVNMQMTEPTPTPPSSSSGGGSSSGGSYRYFRCGNGKCDTGESANTCPKDCALDVEPLSTGLTEDNNVEEDIDLSGLESESSPEVSGSGITGAFAGYVKTKKGIGLIFALLIIVVGIGILAKKK